MAGGNQATAPPPLNFILSENFLLVGHFFKNILILEEFRDKTEILSTHIFSVRNLQLSIRKLQIPASPTFLPVMLVMVIVA